MEIIRKEANPSGAYPAPQNWDSNTPPEGHAVILDTVDMADFYAYNGFVMLTIEQAEVGTNTTINENGEVVNEPIYADAVTAYTPNVEAWETWKASLPEPADPEPTPEERIAELEAANIALEDAMCEMDIANQEQIAELQATNIALEDALCEMDVANEERFVAIEDALCELDKG